MCDKSFEIWAIRAEDCVLLVKGKVLFVVYSYFCIILLLYCIIRSQCACTDLRSGIRVRTTHQNINKNRSQRAHTDLRSGISVRTTQQSLTLPLCRYTKFNLAIVQVNKIQPCHCAGQKQTHCHCAGIITCLSTCRLTTTKTKQNYLVTLTILFAVDKTTLTIY